MTIAQDDQRAARPDHDGVGEPVWPVARNPVLDWLVGETRSERFLDNLFLDMCERLNAAGLMIGRATIHLRVHHPQWLGARILWRRGMVEAEIDTFDYGIEETPQFQRSPARLLYSGVNEVRQILGDPALDEPFPLYGDLYRQGLTEYLAWPLEYTLDKKHIITFSSDRPGGFRDWEIVALRDILPIFALASEVRVKNRMARTLLETYVGPHASEQILAGASTRGSGATIEAAIMICDLRDFTSLSDLWPRDDVIDMLNAYFDALSEPIERQGGEILKFMGDGLLAIFPLSDPEACAKLLLAIRDTRRRMEALNLVHEERGLPNLRFGTGVHIGDVMYGNIGSRRRLDFTAIGPVVNIASRLETLTKDIGRSVLLSGDFVERAGCQDEVDSVGPHVLKGLNHPVDVYALQTPTRISSD
ncbi:adenylate/guanylate cyclase domain-containing protein [Rhizobium sp. G21]|uniref:adenylate/guanylate cyclase domain-containing protein n=1 Tax=Rhizobium sp. G21 TaxID=2758439 RepID=UPI0016030264|nr:adenylate/guanylate cyclase domain-containing protein [Rhizobium sp. G21]MBB1250748.1 adenylate/guanylate cyclase domain-containing protein [Rhizobium sp. G21]